MTTTEERYKEAGMLPPGDGRVVGADELTTVVGIDIDGPAAVVEVVEGSTTVVEPGEDGIPVLTDPTSTRKDARA
ncbi:hypothetical protein L332_03615 [Agrococcus pavilionensis RW1]|uniref:Uncharacterized protein n=1 Tax=Agrococcus pavilionensis RW1 TaxID=1330458 RepID=U1LMG8_9MICO|nr:hypothetical protein [Agrococcus pavilionensis]ERG63539.1 hypothetical protein L332_03615 [Agrococcus pavilionensis RW1]